MDASNKQNGGKKSGILRAVNIALTAVIALLLCFVLLKLFFITWVTVDQSSMYPTYEDGETVFINRSGDVARGEVVVFYDADVSAPRLSSAFGLFAGDAKLLIKRVVAKEGDEIWLEELGGGEYALRIGCADTGETIGEEYVGPDGKPTMVSPYNPNGSMWAIEGITSPDGRVFGKMGHSERIGQNLYKNVPGNFDMKIFESGVNYFK